MSRPSPSVLADSILAVDAGATRLMKQAVLIAAAVLFITAAGHIRIPMWPVPVTMQTFAVLVVGATYGPALAGMSLGAYLSLGSLGAAVFTGNGVAQGGLAYMVGPTGGYLIGFATAAIVVGWLARQGWDRSVARLGAALLVGNMIIYLFGLPWMAWLFAEEKGMAWVVQWGLTNFLVGDLIKLAFAVALLSLLRNLTSGRYPSGN